MKVEHNITLPIKMIVIDKIENEIVLIKERNFDCCSHNNSVSGFIFYFYFLIVFYVLVCIYVVFPVVRSL